MYEIQTDGKVDNYTLVPSYEGIKFGPEMEVFTVDRHFRPVNIHPFLEDSPLYRSQIKPELACEQVEICAPPSSDLQELEHNLSRIIHHLLSLCDLHSIQILPSAHLPGDYSIFPDPRYDLILDTLGPSARDNAPMVASDQVNIGADNPAHAVQIHNNIRSLLPYIMGLSVASPDASVKSTRISAYDLALSCYPDLTGLPPIFNSLDDYIYTLRNLPIFQHPNMFYKYSRPMPQRGVATEVRCMDKQPSLAEYMALTALCKGIMHLEPSGNSLEHNFHAAVSEGIFDHSRFRHLLEYAHDHLPKQEQHYLAPLFTRLEKGTVADRMCTQSHDDIRKYLVESFHENKPYL